MRVGTVAPAPGVAPRALAAAGGRRSVGEAYHVVEVHHPPPGAVVLVPVNAPVRRAVAAIGLEPFVRPARVQPALVQGAGAARSAAEALPASGTDRPQIDRHSNEREAVIEEASPRRSGARDRNSSFQVSRKQLEQVLVRVAGRADHAAIALVPGSEQFERTTATELSLDARTGGSHRESRRGTRARAPTRPGK
jgi:hypothetical protein